VDKCDWQISSNRPLNMPRSINGKVFHSLKAVMGSRMSSPF
jgi:hypothetical protein